MKKKIVFIFFITLFIQFSFSQVINIYEDTKNKFITPYFLRKYKSVDDFSRDNHYSKKKLPGSSIDFLKDNVIEVRMFGNRKIYYLEQDFKEGKIGSNLVYNMYAFASTLNDEKYEIVFQRLTSMPKEHGNMIILNKKTKHVSVISYRIESELSLNPD